MTSLTMWVLAFFLVLIPTGTTVAGAQEVDCTDPQDQTSMNICSYRDWQAADKELNAIWPDIRSKMKETDTYLDDHLKGAEAALLKAQRAWIDYRDGNCAAEGFYARGGTLEPLIVNSCLARMTRQRIEELQGILPDM